MGRPTDLHEGPTERALREEWSFVIVHMSLSHGHHLMRSRALADSK